ncbi:corrinoid protein [Geobacter hydrogenophilus]|uniref:Dimethylamine corrinoid protein n=1 Tax=Geobacter hydrogenophilus TaxID=40983 RepID=A0A9W6G2Y0_9BACT|nr:corrinoid protein [Geobacter hydrogenophilus]MBT0894417.1 corrinoid protein [Geobacter hydrogenophilus]GLI39427.1 dimethylamine corrinoid protein [Geobacter hydrogenophilus]
MSEVKEKLFKELAAAVVDMDEDKAVATAEAVVAAKIDAYEAIEKGLSAGMERAGELFDEEEYFIPELLMCSDAMYAGMDVLKPHIRQDAVAEKRRVVIGVIEGDTHDIGKNLVKIMLETSGFDVTDLGRDIPPARFVDTAREIDADIIALSTLMTTTMDGMGEVVRQLNAEGIRDSFKVIVGGGPISQGFADRIGADGYAVNAADAVRLARRLTAAEAVAA